MGFEITCQMGSVLDMLVRELARADDFCDFADLLNATLPRLRELSEAAAAMFNDPAAFSDDSFVRTVYGRRDAGL
ncbi:MAG: hypothetical protein QM749_03020 [Aquabacterium sp.]